MMNRGFSLAANARGHAASAHRDLIGRLVSDRCESVKERHELIAGGARQRRAQSSSESESRCDNMLQGTADKPQ